MNYYVQRISQMVFVLLAAITVTFVLYRMMPLGPMEILRVQLIQQMTQAGEPLDPDQIERVNRMVEIYTGMHPDEEIHEAYINYMSGVLVGDFGRSIMLDRPVFDVLFSRMPWSLFISFYGLILGTTTSLVLGALMAYTEGTKFDMGMTTFSIVNTTIPYYIVAIAVIIIFGFQLDWFPTAGRYDTSTTPGFNLPFMIGVVKHGTLPIVSAFFAGFGGALAYRGNCIREMGKGYLRVARLRGISEGRLALRYVGRNALLPIYTGLMMSIASIFGSSIILEVIFNYQAVGLITFQALLARDYPLLMGAFIFFTVVTLLGLLTADLTYGIIDPRVKGGGERETF